MRDEPLPKGWREAKLGQLGSFFRGRGGTRSDEEPNGLPCIRYGDLYTHHNCIVRSFASSISSASASFYTRLQGGDVVFAGSGETFEEIGKAAAYCDDSPAFAGADTIIFRPGSELIPQFAGYAVNSESANGHKSRMGQGSSVIHIGAEHLSRMRFCLPPIEQQRRVAEILSTVDEAIEQTEALIAKTQQIKAGLMHDLFTRGVTPDGHLRPPREEAPHLYKGSPLGWIPKEWDVGELNAWLTYRSYGFTNPMPESEEGPYMVTAADINEGRIQYDTCRRTPREAFDRLLTEKSRPKIGDILLTKDGTLGRIAVVDWTDVCINQSVAVLRPKDPNYSRYLAMMLSTPLCQQRILLDAGGSTIKHIYITVIDKMLVAWPKRQEELISISSRVENCTASIEWEKSNLAKLCQQKHGLMHDLLTGRVRVNVSEPAST